MHTVPSEQILVVGPSWVGDMVMTQSLCIALKSRQPDAAIDMLAPAWCGALTERMPQVRNLIDFPFDHGQVEIGKRRQFAADIATRGYNQAIVVPNSLKSALVPFFAGIPKRTGWRGELRYGLLNDMRVLDEETYPTMLSRLVALALPPDASLLQRMPWPRFSVDLQAQAETVAKLGLDLARPVIALCPGAEYGAAKRWPAAHFATLATALVDRGFAVWVFGSGKDADIAEAIRNAVPAALRPSVHSLAGRTSLLEAVDLLAQTTAVVSNDSGLMHVAAAVGKPLIALYGSSSPDYTPPLTAQSKILSLNLACSPCFQRECPLKHLDCLNKLTPAQVLGALEELLGAEITS